MPFSAASCPRAVEHRRRHVDPGRVLHLRGEGAHDDPAAARDVEHRVARSWRGRLDDHPQRVRIGDRVGGAERRRLAGELVQDPLLVALHRSLLLHPNR